MFKKRNFISKLWLKQTDRSAYKQYKWELKNYQQEEFTNFFTAGDRLSSVQKIIDISRSNGHVAVSHSGNAGDVIYALPAIKKIHEITGTPIRFYLRLNKPMVLTDNNTHPLGNVMLNTKMAEMLTPLIQSQPYIDTCEIYTSQKIHIDLDYIRAQLIPLNRTNIAKWCGYITGVSADVYKKWLFVKPDTAYASSIVLARSERYRNSTIDFSFLSAYSNIMFVGVRSEFEDMKKSIPNLQWLQVTDFLELAKIIAGCKFFIGNQSFPFSIAEGLKVPRILELYYHLINVIPEGENAYDYFFQEHFEWLVKDLNEKKSFTP